MPWGMGLSKDRHGTYYAIKKVPAQLQEAVADVLDNGKQRQVWLKRSLGTKDRSEANRRVTVVQIEFDRTLERAKGLLAARKLSVTEIALDVGFSELSSFTSAFRKVTGETPTDYRCRVA